MCFFLKNCFFFLNSSLLPTQIPIRVLCIEEAYECILIGINFILDFLEQITFFLLLMMAP